MTTNILQRFRRVFAPPGPAGVLTTPPIDHSQQLRNEIAPLIPLINALVEDGRSVVAAAEERAKEIVHGARLEASATLDTARGQVSDATEEASRRVRPDPELTSILEHAQQEAEHVRRSAAERIEELASIVTRCVEETGTPE